LGSLEGELEAWLDVMINYDEADLSIEPGRSFPLDHEPSFQSTKSGLHPRSMVDGFFVQFRLDLHALVGTGKFGADRNDWLGSIPAKGVQVRLCFYKSWQFSPCHVISRHKMDVALSNF
jgi:hypothetical protein